MKRLFLLLLIAVGVWAGVIMFPEHQPEETVAWSWPEVKLDAVSSMTLRSVSANGSANGSVKEYTVQRVKDGLTQWMIRLTPDGPYYPVVTEKVVELVLFMNTHAPIRHLGHVMDTQKAEYGLDSPSIAISVINDQPFQLDLGLLNSSRDGAYGLLSTEPEQLLLLDPGYMNLLHQPASAFFDLSVVSLLPEQVTRLSFSGRDGGWEAMRDKDKFVFASPADRKGMLLAPSKATFYLHAICDAKAVRLLPNEPMPEGVPLFEIKLWQSGELPSDVIRIYAGENGRFLGRSTRLPGTFSLDRERVEQLNKTAFALSDRRVAPLDMGTVHTVHIRRSDKELEAVRKNSAWKGRNGTDLVGFDMELWRLTDLSFDTAPSGELPPEAKKELSVVLLGKDNATVGTMDFYTDPGLPGGVVWLKTAGRKGYFPVADTLVKDLNQRLHLDTSAVQNGKQGS